MNGFQFHDPLVLILLAPLLVFAVVAVRRQRRVAMPFSDVALVGELPRTLGLRMRSMLGWMWTLGMAFLVVALARPQYGEEQYRIQSEGIAIEMCLDRSGSMQTVDFQLDGKSVDRLTAVKAIFRDFVQGNRQLRGRPNDLIGLVDFGGFVDCKCPLTLDREALLDALEKVQVAEPIVDPAGNVLNQSLLEEDIATAIGDAVVLAVDRLKNVPAKSKVIVLLSDGQQTSGIVEPAEAAEIARLHDIRIHTIDIGSTGTAPIPEGNPTSEKGTRPQRVGVETDAMKVLAEKTGGKYFQAASADMLQGVYAQIDRLEKTSLRGRRYTEYGELYPYVLWLGLGLVLLEIMLASTRLRPLP